MFLILLHFFIFLHLYYNIMKGLVMGLFYHLYTHDKEGWMGITLRSAVQSTKIQGTMDDQLFATVVVTAFMQISGMLMLPELYGPSYNLLLLPKRILTERTNQATDSSSKTAKGKTGGAKPPTGGKTNTTKDSLLQIPQKIRTSFTKKKAN